MQNGVLNIIAPHGLENLTPTRYNGKPIFGIYYDAARRFFIRSFVLRIINAKLTVLTLQVTPPPRLTYNKVYYFHKMV